MTDHSPTQTEALLARLVAFDVTSADSNLGLIDWVEHYLRSLGFAVHLVPDEGGEKAGLYASIGPRRPGGVLLSAHSDVVSVEGQTWTRPPFELGRDGTRLYGRGTTDMKGFLASVLAAADLAARANLAEPFKIALSYDEEVGCTGAPPMIAAMQAVLPQASAAVIGEPSRMKLIHGHKGGTGYHVHVKGFEVHSSLLPYGVSAIMEGARLIGWVNAKNAETILSPGEGDALLRHREHRRVARAGRADQAHQLAFAQL